MQNEHKTILILRSRIPVVSLDQLDCFFEELATHSSELLPDGIIDINIATLLALQLLSEECPGPNTTPIAHLLQAIESDGKVTLFNDNFVIWIVPRRERDEPVTTVYIARRYASSVKPELAFRAAGIHNRSRTILRLIDKYLAEILDTENVLSTLTS